MAWNKKPESQSQPEPSSSDPQPSAPRVRLATLGPSIFIKGKLSGEEDLLIEGRIEGEITLKEHSVTIGRSGKVKAEIHSKNICVEGEVSGNLFASEEVIIRKSGRVEGDATAPRVMLENGAKFRGTIDMQPQGDKKPGEAGADRSSTPAESWSPSARKKRSDASAVASPPKKANPWKGGESK